LLTFCALTRISDAFSATHDEIIHTWRQLLIAMTLRDKIAQVRFTIYLCASCAQNASDLSITKNAFIVSLAVGFTSVRDNPLPADKLYTINVKKRDAFRRKESKEDFFLLFLLI